MLRTEVLGLGPVEFDPRLLKLLVVEWDERGPERVGDCGRGGGRKEGKAGKERTRRACGGRGGGVINRREKERSC